MDEWARSKVTSDGTDLSGREWRRSSRSYGSGNCLEVATPHGARIDVRDSKNADGAVLTFSPTQWNSFVVSVRSGVFA